MATPSATIQTGEVHVWSLSFSDAESNIANLNQLLSDDEQTRAVRFISDCDRIRFTIARGVLRQLLSALICHIRENMLYSPCRVNAMLVSTLNVFDPTHRLIDCVWPSGFFLSWNALRYKG